MRRTTRAFLAFGFGAAVVLSGLALTAFVGKVQGAVLNVAGPYLNGDEIGNAGTALLLGGLVIEGLALLGWIIAPTDDR